MTPPGYVVQFSLPPADASFSLRPSALPFPVDRSVSGLNEFPFLFITRWCPAAPVNTFLQQAIHRYTLAAETPVMNFNLLSAKGAAPWVRLIKGNSPSNRGGGVQTDWAQVYPIIILSLPLCSKLVPVSAVSEPINSSNYCWFNISPRFYPPSQEKKSCVEANDHAVFTK